VLALTSKTIMKEAMSWALAHNDIAYNMAYMCVKCNFDTYIKTLV